MTREQWKERLPLIQAFVDGKDLSIKGVPDKLVSPTFSETVDVSYYTISTEPKLRPWKIEEVPVGAVVRMKDRKSSAMIIGAYTDGCGDVWMDFGIVRVPDISALTNYEYRRIGETEWKPCGVEVEA